MHAREAVMKRITAIVSVLLLAGCQGQQERLKADIERVGGTVEFDDHKPAKPMIAVDLHGIVDADKLLARLEGQTQLRRLDLGGADVSDENLAPLRGMTELEELNLSATQIGDEGLQHLAGLAHLRELGLGGTRVTDAGLPHLHRMKGLERMNLAGTKVTEAGIKELREALPRVAIQTLPPKD
jgi:hypothetical protein